jgi:hypothetical protein
MTTPQSVSSTEISKHQFSPAVTKIRGHTRIGGGWRKAVGAAIQSLLIVLGIAASLSNAYAEPCRMIGCVGNVGYIHVPRSQLQSSTIFRKPGLPNVNTIERLSANVALLASHTFGSPNYANELRRDLKSAVESNTVLAGWGSGLRPESKVRILSYQTFPSLDHASEEVFALVLVISD